MTSRLGSGALPSGARFEDFEVAFGSIYHDFSLGSAILILIPK